MKKRIRLIKRVISLLLVLIFSIESFAAVVSDNDGSAFITKAEFDSLKNEFQAQLNQYNTSIDNKIDEAIAAYLAGITLKKEETKSIIFHDWETGVTCLNYKPTVTWQKVNLELSFTQSWYLSDGGWRQSGEATGAVVYNRPSSSKQVIFICDAGINTQGKEVTSTSQDPNQVMWKGRAYNYQDKLIVSQVYKSTSGYNKGVTAGSARFNKWACFGTGCWSNLTSNARTIWWPQMYWYHPNSSYNPHYISLGSLQSRSVSTEVKLEAGSNGKDVDYEHIITWGTGFNSVYIADPTWLKHLTSNPSYTGNSYNASESGMSVSGSWFATEAHTTQSNSGSANSGSTSNYKGDNSNTSNTNLPVIGLLSKTYRYDTLYQYKDKVTADIGDKQIKSSSIPILSDGFPLLAAKKGETITWEPSFKDSKKGTSKVTEDIYLRLCVNEFGTTDNLKSSNSTYCKDLDNKDASGNYKDYFIIKNNSGKIRWEMPKDGIVYAKWRHNTIGTGNWEITLDVPNCNTFKRKDAEK